MGQRLIWISGLALGSWLLVYVVLPQLNDGSNDFIQLYDTNYVFEPLALFLGLWLIMLLIMLLVMLAVKMFKRTKS